MPCAKLKSDGGREEGAADGEQPAGARVGAAQAAGEEDRDGGDEREAEQPAGLPAEGFVEEAQRAGRAAEDVGAAERLGSAALAFDAAEAVVSKDQREDRVVRGARDPGAVGGGRQFDEQRPGAADEQHRAAAGEQLAQGAQTAARRDPQPGGGDPGDDGEGDQHLGLEPEADADTGEDEPAGATRPFEGAQGAPEGGDAAEDQQGVGVVVARDRDGDRGQREHEPGDESCRAPEAAAGEVVDEQDGRDAHQGLRREDRDGVEAEQLDRGGLDPQRERGLVDGHDAAGVEGSEQEVVPALAHRAHGAAVVEVGPAVAAETPEVQESGEQRERDGLGPDAADCE